MISINTSSVVKLTDRSAVSLCMLGASNQGTGLSGIRAARLVSSHAPAAPAVRERDERTDRGTGSGSGTGEGLCLCGSRCRIPEADDAAPPDVGLPWARTLE
ncbi:hypothetical protein GCM10023238_38850 [Streptomyces heliomycini]